MVLGLSDTMRYMIYETEQKLVHLEKELNFVRNYLELEKMRISSPENIRVSELVRNLSVFVPPLLLLPFIENCFKHGSIGKDDDGWMEIDIWDEKDSLFFVCKNNFNESRSVRSSGIGLANVQKRLQLIFNERYKLKTLEQNNEFMVSLQFPVFQRKDML
jgi:sensor histidine kinase YesM